MNEKQFVPTAENVLDLMQNSMAICQKTHRYYMAAVEFMDKKGILSEFEDYFLKRYLEEQQGDQN